MKFRLDGLLLQLLRKGVGLHVVSICSNCVDLLRLRTP